MSQQISAVRPGTSGLPAGVAPLTPDEQQQLAAAFAALRPRSESIADAVASQLLDGGDTGYDLERPDRAVELRASIRDHIRRGIDRLAGEPSDSVRAVDLWRATGRRRAQQGIPMALVLATYNIGTRRMWEGLLEVGEELKLPDHLLLRAGRVLWSGLDVQIQVLRESYRREELAREGRDPARINEVLDGLLRGRGAEQVFAAEAREVLGMAQDSSLLCLVWLPAESMTPTDLVRGRLQDAGYLSYWRRHGAHVVGIVPDADDGARVRRVLARSVQGRVGTATCRDGLAGVLDAQQSALAAADSVPRGEDAVVDITERLPEALLAANPALTSLLLEETLQPLMGLEGDTREVLLETLTAVVRRGGSATYAAEDLVCHRNTVIYRVKRIEQLTGRSLDDPRDRLLLSLAVIATRARVGTVRGPAS